MTLPIFGMKIFLAIVGAVGLALVIAACGGSDPTRTAPLTATPTSSLTPALTEEGAGRTAIPASVQSSAFGTSDMPEIIKALTPSVVHIQTEGVRLDQFNQPVPVGGVGTGEIIDDQGHVLTNNHVIDGAETILVTLSDGRAFEAELIGGDATLDLAVLRIDAEGLVPIPIGKSSALRVGDAVVVIGHALNLPGGPTITGGWVSALNRSIDVSPTITMRNLIQTDAAINPGNSGGVLINVAGEMVGIPTAKLPSGEGIGFAIAIDPAMPQIEELIANGRIDRGFFGVSGVNISEALARNGGLPVTFGVGIASVAPDSPAERAGLRVQDIIVGLAGKMVSNTAELDGILIQYRSSETVAVDFYRGDQKRTVNVTLGERPR